MSLIILLVNFYSHTSICPRRKIIILMCIIMSFTMYYDYHTKWGFHAYANSEDPDVKACISSQINQVLYSLQNEGLDSAEFTGKK